MRNDIIIIWLLRLICHFPIFSLGLLILIINFIFFANILNNWYYIGVAAVLSSFIMFAIFVKISCELPDEHGYNRFFNGEYKNKFK